MPFATNGTSGLRLAGNDRIPACQRKMPLLVGSLHVFEIGIAESGLLQAIFKILELSRRAHFANAQNIRVDFTDDLDERVDFLFRLWREHALAAVAPFHAEIVFEIVSRNHDFTGLRKSGDKQREVKGKKEGGLFQGIGGVGNHSGNSE